MYSSNLFIEAKLQALMQPIDAWENEGDYSSALRLCEELLENRGTGDMADTPGAFYEYLETKAGILNGKISEELDNDPLCI